MILFLNLFLHPASILSQQVDETKNQTEKKPNIIFKSTRTDSTVVKPNQNTMNNNIIFKNNFYNKNENKIELISEDRYSINGEEKMVGEEGGFLIQEMGDNQLAIDMVKDAYSSKDTGSLLMVLGGVGAAVALATIPTVELNESSSGNTTTTIYWIPAVTIGLAIGGYGYVKYTSLESDLRSAVNQYNKDLDKQESEDDY